MWAERDPVDVVLPTKFERRSEARRKDMLAGLDGGDVFVFI